MKTKTILKRSIAKIYNPQTAFGNIDLIKRIKDADFQIEREKLIKKCGDCDDFGYKQRDCYECDGRGYIEETCDHGST